MYGHRQLVTAAGGDWGGSRRPLPWRGGYMKGAASADTD